MLSSNLSPLDRATLSLSYGDYLRFRQLMEDRFGLTFPEKRRMELEIGVRRAFAASTCVDLDSYFQILCDPVHGVVELERLVNHLTVGETHFFRDAGQMDALVTTVLPQMIERRRAVRSLRIWSAGCASGEEPFSIAMLLRDLIPDIDYWSITILGTDINTHNLERARRGLYGEWAFRELRAKQYRPRFFTQRGNQYELSQDVRRMVTLRHLNLAEDTYPSYENNTMFMDLILCRNVTIYFPELVTRVVVDRFYNALSDGGWLVIGHSEHSLNTYQRFYIHNFPDAILYQRLSEPPKAKEGGSAPTGFLPDLSVFAQPGISAATNVPTQPPPVMPTVPLSAPLSSMFTNNLAANPPVSTPPETPPAQVPPAVVSPTVVPPASTKTKGAAKLQGGLPDNVAGDEFEQAQVLMNQGYVDQARDLLLRWLVQHPNHPQACTMLGKAYANMGNWPESERWCQLAVTVDRLNLDAYYTLALVFQHQGYRDRAVEMMKKVVYIDRNDILGHFSLANLYYTGDQMPLALKYLENARRLLEARTLDDLVPRSADVTVGRLAQTVLELQQVWAKEAASGGQAVDKA